MANNDNWKSWAVFFFALINMLLTFYVARGGKFEREHPSPSAGFSAVPGTVTNPVNMSRLMAKRGTMEILVNTYSYSWKGKCHWDSKCKETRPHVHHLTNDGEEVYLRDVANERAPIERTDGDNAHWEKPRKWQRGEWVSGAETAQ